MNLTINGEPRTFEDDHLTLTGLLENLGLSGKPVVIELDRQPVLPAAYPDTAVSDGAELEIVTIAAGG